MITKGSYTLFWSRKDVFSNQHTNTPFKYKGIPFRTVEHFMMYCKAALFKDTAIMNKILETKDPQDVKKLGRKVSNFKNEVWAKHRKRYVYIGNRAKFIQNKKALEILLDTKGTMLVEASPYDEIWGVKLSENHPDITKPEKWRGANLLGEVLTELREDFLNGNILKVLKANNKDDVFKQQIEFLENYPKYDGNFLKEYCGNLIYRALNKEFDVIIHGANCFCTMGSGIAAGIKEYFPKAYQVDQETKSGDKNKLGSYTYTEDNGVIVINAYTQYGYGPKGEKAYNVKHEEKDPYAVHADYEGMEEIFEKINVEFKGKKVGLPLIGAGLAGGDWKKIEKIIKDKLTDVDVTIVHFRDGVDFPYDFKKEESVDYGQNQRTI